MKKIVFCFFLVNLGLTITSCGTTAPPQASIPVKPAPNLTIEPVTLNPAIDDIQQLDPRLKTVIMYAHYEQTDVKVVYFSTSTKRYASKVVALFKSNKVNSVTAAQQKSSNLMDQNLVKIYMKGTNDVESGT